MTPVLMLGAGRMGGALIEGWLAAGLLAPNSLMIRDPEPGPAAEAAAEAGAALNPPDDTLGVARTVILAVKPQIWRTVAGEVADLLAPEAVIISIAAGVRLDAISEAFGGRACARVMPTTAAAIRQGTASLYAADEEAFARASELMAAVGTVVRLPDEDLMHAATAVSGSSPAYLYAFVEALEAAACASGIAPQDAAALVRSTLCGAAVLMGRSPLPPSELRRQVTSPGGTTEAALHVLQGEAGLGPLLGEAVQAAVRRSRELG